MDNHNIVTEPEIRSYLVYQYRQNHSVHLVTDLEPGCLCADTQSSQKGRIYLSEKPGNCEMRNAIKSRTEVQYVKTMALYKSSLRTHLG